MLSCIMNRVDEEYGQQLTESSGSIAKTSVANDVEMLTLPDDMEQNQGLKSGMMTNVTDNNENTSKGNHTVRNGNMVPESEDTGNNLQCGDVVGNAALSEVGANVSDASTRIINHQSADQEVVDEHRYAANTVQVIIHQEPEGENFDNIEVDGFCDSDFMSPYYQSEDDNKINIIMSQETGTDLSDSQEHRDTAGQTDNVVGIEDVQGIDVICGNCGKHFHSLSSLSLHLSSHHDFILDDASTTSIEVLQDEECPEEAAASIKNHDASTNSSDGLAQTSVEVLQDGKLANDKVSVNNHGQLTTTSVVEKYHCHVCSKEFLSKRLLLRHSRICEEITDSSDVTKQSISDQSSGCKASFVPVKGGTSISSLTHKTDRSSLRAHNQAKHAIESQENGKSDTDDVDYEISESSNDFQSRSSSRRGLLKVTIGDRSRQKQQGSMPDFVLDSDSDESEESHFPIHKRTCKYCGKILSRPSNMRKHVRNIHENPLKTPEDAETAAVSPLSQYKKIKETPTHVETIGSRRQQSEKAKHEAGTDVALPSQQRENGEPCNDTVDARSMSLHESLYDDEDWDSSCFSLQSRTCKYCGKVLSRPSNMRKHVKNVHENHMKTQRTEINTLSLPQQKRKGEQPDNDALVPFQSQRETPQTTRVSGQRQKNKVVKLRPVVKRVLESNVKHDIDNGTVVVITNNTDGMKNLYTGNKRVVQCPECSRILSSQHSLMEHMRTHTGEKPFKCEECERPFSTPRNLKKHMISVHSGTKAYKCNECGKDFALKSSLKAHSKFHTGTFRYHCAACGKGFQTPASLRRHEIIHTGERPFACDQCGRRFNDSSALKKHVFFHTGEKPHVCDKCGHSFATLSSLRYHDLVHSGVSAYQCPTCGKSYRTNSSLQRHQRIHSGEKPFVCDYCSDAFPERWQLVAHHREHTGEKPFACSHCHKSFSTLRKLTRHTHIHNPSHLCTYCGKSFTTASFLKTHMYKHTGEHPHCCTQCPKRFSTGSALKRHEATHTGLKPYICDFCGKRFSSSIGLKHHTTLHTGDRPHICETCGKGFPNKTALRIHSQFHNAEKQFQCDLCSKRFHRVYELKHHSLIHNNDKSFKCDQCDKAYHHKSALMAHINTHTEERWYPCDECNKSFLREGTLRKHKKIHAAVKPHQCTQCEKRFVRKEHLRRHLATHAGAVSKVGMGIVDEIVEFDETLTSDCIMNLEETSIVAEHVEMDLEDDD